ncbi:MAG: hypothetical protein HQK79_22000 [Desulfobacterales bacterium]|nr:hypothetical protein [Desulfobacterales bacterium]
MSNNNVEIFKDVLNLYKADYDRMLNLWNCLETKAMGNISFSGIILSFLSFYITYFKNPKSFVYSILEKIFLISIIIFLISTIIYSIKAVFITNFSYTPTEKMYKCYCDINDSYGNVGNVTSELLLAFYSEQIELWKKSCFSIKSQYELKAKKIQCGQICLVFSICVFAFFILSIIFIH